ncbi:MAG: AlkA N-terminal domain-containing protein, partial [Pseudomonadota bacterium]
GTLRRGTGGREEELSLILTYQPPYDWQAILDFLRLRAITGVELVNDVEYARVLQLEDTHGLVRVRHLPDHNALKVTTTLPRIELLPQVIARVRRVFDLGADPAAISDVLSRDPALARHVKKRPGLRLPGAWDGLEIGVRAILGQQVSVKAATTLVTRLVEKYGTRTKDDKDLTHIFPAARILAEADLSGLGMTQRRIDAIAALARLAVERPELFDGGADPEELTSALIALPGIGPWTANYMAMRVARATDAFIEGDLVVRKSFSGEGDMISPRALAAHSAQWRPWRAYAVMHLWAAV